MPADRKSGMWTSVYVHQAQGSMVKVNSKFLKEQHPDTKLATLAQLTFAAKDIDEVMSFIFGIFD